MTTETPSPERGDFIREIVAADLREGRHADRRHPLPAGAERLPPHRSRQVHLPQLRHRPGVRRPLPPALRRHQPHEGGAGVHRRHPGRRALARVRLGRAPVLRLRLLRAALRVGGRPRSRPARPTSTTSRADEIREHRGTLTEPGRDSPWRDRPAEESLDLFARMRAGEFPDGARVLRAKIDMAVAQHQPARPGPLPHPPRRAPAHGRRLVHLPDLRLRPRPVGRDRGHHALALHARVRGPPAALRLAHRATCRCLRARARSSSRGSTSPTPCCPSACCCGSSTRATCAAGTTRACRRISGLRRRGFPAEGIRDFATHGRRGQDRQRGRGRACSSTRCATC